MPWRTSSREVTRVSSAAIASTSRRTRTARAVTSSRLPIGVATTNRRLTCLPALGGGPEQERALRLFERLEQLPALAVDALREDEHVVEVDALLQCSMHVAQLPVRRE